MYLVGLTGGLGSGKSTVAQRCVERGWPVLDADAVAREIVEVGEPALPELAERFGEQVLRADGSLDRQELARRAFADEDGKAALDAITHPRIGQRLRDRIVALRDAADPPAVAVLDHPLLLETGTWQAVDAVVVVLADEEVRVERLVEQRGVDPDDARARIRAQTDDATRRARADHVIDNDGDRDALDAALAPVLDAVARAAAARAAAGPGERAADRW